MGRKKIRRLIQMAPHYSGLRPLGSQNKKITEAVILHFEEFEAIKLCDYEFLSQLEAAEVMNISRPTLTRIYENARRKIAIALIEGREIYFDEGDTQITEWNECKKCKIVFTTTAHSTKNCPFCEKINHENKTVIASDKDSLKSYTEGHFGRANWLCIYDNKTNSYEFIENPVITENNNAGSNLADILIALGTTIVIAGRFGSMAAKKFRSYEIQMIIPQTEINIHTLLKKIEQ